MDTSTVRGKWLRQTEKAILIKQGEKEHWIPRSVIPLLTKQKGKIIMEVEDWWLEKNLQVDTI